MLDEFMICMNSQKLPRMKIPEKEILVSNLNKERNNDHTSVEDVHWLNLCHNNNRQDANPESKKWSGQPNIRRPKLHSHAENSELKVSKTVSKLKERERDEQGDKSADKDTGENIIRRPPECEVVSLDYNLELIKEGSGICGG
jgi:hypothetical protein